MRQRKKAEEWQFVRFALQTHRNDSFAPWNLYESFPSWLTCCHFFFGTLRQCKSQGCSKFSRPTPGAGPSKRGVTSRHRTHAVSTLDTAVKTIDSHKWEETNNKASLDQPSMSSLLCFEAAKSLESLTFPYGFYAGMLSFFLWHTAKMSRSESLLCWWQLVSAKN